MWTSAWSTRKKGCRSIPRPGNHANHVDKAGDRSQYDAGEKEPVRVQPMVEQLADQQAGHHGCGNDKGDLRIARPYHGGAVLWLIVLARHSHRLSPFVPALPRPQYNSAMRPRTPPWMRLLSL